MTDPRIEILAENDTYDVPDHGLTVNIVKAEDGWWATWLQAGIGSQGESRTAALRALANTMDRVEVWGADFR